MVFLRGFSPHIRTTAFCAAAFLLGLAAFIPSIVAWFTSEELVLISIVQTDLFAVWSGRGGPGFFRPVVPMIVWVWYNLFGLEPRPYHLLNVALHLANSCLVYAVARGWAQCLPKANQLRSSSAAAIAALWFWVWPSHSEPVSWIPALTDVAAAVWALASLATYLHYRNGDKWPWAVGAILLYAGGLCTKESVITLPAVLFLYEAMRAIVCRTWRVKDFIWPAIFLTVMLGYFVLRRVLTGVFIGGYGTAVHTNFGLEHLRWTVMPNLANAFLPLPIIDANQKNWLIPLSALLCALAIFWRSRRTDASAYVSESGGENPPIGRYAGGFWIIAAMAVSAVVVLLPGINLGPGQIMEGQRFAYLASAPAVISVAYTAAYLLPRGRSLSIVGWCVAIACAALLATYNTSWYRAGKVARQAARGMKKLPPARRLYVLTTTGSCREALVLPHNLDLISRLVLKQPREGEMVMTGIVKNWTPETKVLAENAMRNGIAGYMVRLEFPGEKTPASPRLEPLGGPSEQWAIMGMEGDALYMQPKDFDPAQDKTVWLNGGKWEISP